MTTKCFRMNTEPLLYIVDDDPEECYLMHLAITDTGWANAVQFFSSAEELLQHLTLLPAAAFPSLLLLDYHMPQINGGELLHLLKSSETFHHIPVVIYSTLLTPALERGLMHAGALQCFTKVQHYAGAIDFANILKALMRNHLPLLHPDGV